MVQELWLSERATFSGSYQADVATVNCCHLYVTTVLKGMRGKNVVLSCDIQNSLCFMNCLSR